MARAESEIDELKRYCAAVAAAEESGCTYFRLEGLALPEGCSPPSCDALLCPTARDGYESRLFFSAPVQGRYSRNWTGPVRILDRNWYVFSWRVSTPNLRLAELVVRHLEGLTREK
jgi:hypothetical protein